LAIIGIFDVAMKNIKIAILSFFLKNYLYDRVKFILY